MGENTPRVHRGVTKVSPVSHGTKKHKTIIAVMFSKNANGNVTPVTPVDSSIFFASSSGGGAEE